MLLSINASLTKSKKDSIKNIKFIQNISNSSTPAYPKKQSEGKETNPSDNLEGRKSKQEDTIKAERKNLTISENQIMTIVVKATQIHYLIR